MQANSQTGARPVKRNSASVGGQNDVQTMILRRESFLATLPKNNMTNRSHISIKPSKPVVTKKNRAYWDSNPLLSPTNEAVQAAEQRGQKSWDAFRASVSMFPNNPLRSYPDKNTRKKCTGKHSCGRTFTLDHFHKNPRSKNGRRNNCKYCAREYIKRLYYIKKAKENGEPRR